MTIPPQEATQTLLVVDDEPANIRILGETLRGQYRLIVATDGAQALERARSSPTPDLILLDVQMPGMSGHEVCRQLKEDDALNSIPVIFITALSSDEDEALGLDLGAVDYITKPFSHAVVKARVRAHIELQLHREHLQDLVEAKTRDVRKAQKQMVTHLAGIADEFLSLKPLVDEMSRICSSCADPRAAIVWRDIETAILRVIDGEGSPPGSKQG